MSRYLIDNAIQQVWCAPGMDNQIRIAPTRITQMNGDLNTVSVMDRVISLPVTGRRFHVYYLGRAWPALLGLVPFRPSWAESDWIKLSDAVNHEALFASMYTDRGLHYPLFGGYYKYTIDGALIFAVEIFTRHPVKLNTEKLWFRFYTNAYFKSQRPDLTLPYTHTNGLQIINVNQIIAFQQEVNIYKAKRGNVLCFVNGCLVESFNVATTVVGDFVEYIYDSSIKNTVTLKVRDLPVFQSDLDQKFKYLVHYPDTEPTPVINYQDDVDIYIVGRNSVQLPAGVYFHHNQESSIRMVTHRDYSIAVDYYAFITDALRGHLGINVDILDFSIQLTVRNDGFGRPLIFDDNRIFELYKLKEEDIIPAMTGTETMVAEWKAAALENSAYTRLMRVEYRDIDIKMVEDAYGYNSLSRLLGDTPGKPRVDVNGGHYDLPAGLQTQSTMYEYNTQGVLTGAYRHDFGPTYYRTNAQIALIEGIVGYGSEMAPAVFGTDLIPIPSNVSYRVYMCYVIGGVPNEKWKDITGSELYEVRDGVLHWTNLEYDQYLMVRHDGSFLDYEIDIEPIGGTFSFSLYEHEMREGVFTNTLMPVPPGDLDVWINGKPAIRDIDYVVQFPQVYIVSKWLLKQPTATETQQVRVRMTGFCNSDLTLDAVEDKGFIINGLMSRNGRFNIRDDKVLRILVNGSLRHRDDLVFSEDNSGVGVINVENGMPYQITDIKVPFKSFTERDTYVLREHSLEIDKRVEDYLTINLPEPPGNVVDPIPTRYAVHSPFICRIAYDIMNGHFDLSQIEKELSDNDIFTICAPYEHILAFDPIADENLDHRFMVIHPVSSLENAPLRFNLYGYKFMDRVVRLYSRGLVSINNFFTIV